MLFLDCVFLKREWRRDEASIKRVFSRIGDNKLPVWLMSFPEGTRATPTKLEKARLKWKSTYRHLLPPRQKGFTASVIGLRDHVKAVYSVTIGYHGEVPTLVGMIRGDVRVVSIDVRRTPIEELPRDEAALGAWLERDFRRKDELLERFAREGRLVEKPALV
jgi:1-acyl-sn-glycerol-3-phosphate acyltransferase